MSKQLPSAEMTRHLQATPPLAEILKKESDSEIVRRIIKRELMFNENKYGTIMCCNIKDPGSRVIVNYSTSGIWALILQKTGFIQESEIVLDLISREAKKTFGKIAAMQAPDGVIYSVPTMFWALAAKDYGIIESLKQSGMYANDQVRLSTTETEPHLPASLMMALVEERFGRDGTPIIEKIRKKPEYPDGLITFSTNIDGKPATNIYSLTNSLLAMAFSPRALDEAQKIVEKLKTHVSANGKISKNRYAESNDAPNYDPQGQALWYMAQRCVGLDAKHTIPPIRKEVQSVIERFDTFTPPNYTLAIIALARQTL